MNNSLNSIFLSLNLQCVTVIFLCVQSLKPKVCPTAQSHECKKQNRNICGADDHFEFSYLMSKGPFALFLSACLTPMLHCSHISFLESCQPEFPSINHSVGRLVEAANSLFRTANGDGWECGWMRRGEVKRRASEAFTLTCFSNWSNTEAVWNWRWWKNQFSIYSWHQAFILKCKQGVFVIIYHNLIAEMFHLLTDVENSHIKGGARGRWWPMKRWILQRILFWNWYSGLIWTTRRMMEWESELRSNQKRRKDWWWKCAEGKEELAGISLGRRVMNGKRTGG